VVAGPNGVGKTRLTQQLLALIRSPKANQNNFLEIEATSVEEVEAWGKKQLTTTDKNDCELLKKFLHQNRFRRNLKSSVIHIESNRAITNYQPFAFTWDLQDPDEEQIGWDTTFQTLNNRFNDTQNSIFKKILALRNTLGSEAMNRRRQGASSMGLHFSDPLDPYKEAFEALLGPKKLIQPDLQGQKLRYEHNGNQLNVDQLSSGEKEVVNITFDIILRSPSNSIFVIDEPELHLHPELSYRLIRTLQNIGENNQFFFFTHSAEIISSSIDDTVLFMRPPNAGANQAVRAGKDDETTSGLKLLGQSIGVIALGKRIALIEGEESSIDKKVYGSVLNTEYNDFVLLPVGSVKTLHNFESIKSKILDKTIWGVDFFMLCDHDAPYSDDTIKDDNSYPRLRRIGRYHIENYFLEEDILAACFAELNTDTEWLKDPAKIRSRLIALAELRIGYATSLIVSRTIWKAAGNVKIIPNATDATEDSLTQLMIDTADKEAARIQQVLDKGKVESMTRDIFQRLTKSLQTNDDWKTVIPAKPILKSFLSEAGIKEAHIKALYIKKAKEQPNDPFDEIRKIFDYFRTVS